MPSTSGLRASAPTAFRWTGRGATSYLRDDDTGEYWSVSWQPVGKDLAKASYQCRHGLSYSKFSCDYQDLHAEQTVFIPVDDDAELWDVRIKNTGSRQRHLSVFSYLEFSFHHIEIDNQNLQMSLYASGASYQDGIIEYDFFYEPWTFHYFASNFEPDSYDCMRTVSWELPDGDQPGGGGAGGVRRQFRAGRESLRCAA